MSAQRHPIARLFRIRDYSLLWSGSTVSLFGDGIYFVAIPWEVYHLSSSPAAYGFVGAAFALPQVLFVLVGGVISDRLNRRALMIGASVSSAVAIGVLGLLIELHLEQLWMIGALVFLYGTSQAIFMPASKALTPSLVPVELLPQATAMNQLLEPITLAVVGPAVGGLIIAAFGTGAAFLVDSATFAVAVAAMALMSGGAIKRAAAEGPGRKASVLREAREAIGFVRRTPWIWAGLLSAAIANISLTGPLTVLTPYVVKYNLHGSATDLGLIFAVGGVGGVIAGVYVAVRGAPRRKVTWTFLAWAIATLAMSPIGFATATWQLMLLSIVIVGGLTLGNLIWFTLMGTLVPNEMLGRVSSLDMMVSFSLTPVSNALTGPVAVLAGVRNTLLGAGILGAVVGVAALLVPGARDPEKAKVAGAPTSA
jgi:MFS family permease